MNVILVDSSYTSFYRFFATFRWFTMAKKEEVLSWFDMYATTLAPDAYNFDDVFWVDVVKTDLDQGRPLVYKGYTSDYSAGHAFVVDGYDGDYFHLNWGWSGSYNGWYLLSNLSPGGYTFSTWQGVTVDRR